MRKERLRGPIGLRLFAFAVVAAATGMLGLMLGRLLGNLVILLTK